MAFHMALAENATTQLARDFFDSSLIDLFAVKIFVFIVNCADALSVGLIILNRHIPLPTGLALLISHGRPLISEHVSDGGRIIGEHLVAPRTLHFAGHDLFTSPLTGSSPGCCILIPPIV